MNKQEKAKHACEKTMSCIQQALKSLTSLNTGQEQQYEVQEKKSRETTKTEDHRLTVKQKEIIIYNPSPENDFVVLQNEREEINAYPKMGVRLINRETTHYVQTSEAEIFITEIKTLAGGFNEALTQTSTNTTIQINHSNI